MDEKISRLVARLPSEGLAVSELPKFLGELKESYGEGLLFTHRYGRTVIMTPGKECGCEDCRLTVVEDFKRVFPDELHPHTMILCPTCGHKRCPKATFHGNVCTNSNEPGQSGSSYPPLEA